MPISALIPLSRKFITKDLNNRIAIVKRIYNIRVAVHASLFTAVNVVPHVDEGKSMKITDEVLKMVESIQI